jgi:hypothetical protein
MSHAIHLIEVYCTGSPIASHERRYVARMVRTVRMDGTTGWAVARDGGQQPAADQRDHNRFNLRCRRPRGRGGPKCPINAQTVVDQTRGSAYDRLVQELNDAAAAGKSELTLYELAGIVSQ